ncbi:MAG TPA: prepilin-type N-terminal cleavage/methylation domain-containing protein, partial [Gemmataceae bacterium]|nr:prepilin-type N-terminal cleavage/methylation domain-containing protein [Gemmataceae bacterium]
MTHSPRRRLGYTLLEVLLALAIGVLLLAALYAAVRIQFRLTQSGRDRVERATLARSVLARMQSDIAPSLPPYDPTRTQAQGGSPGGGGMQGGGSQGGGSQGGSTQGGAASPSGSGSSGSGSGSGGSQSTTGAVTNLNGPVTFNLGVQGDANHLTLYVSRAPRELTAALAAQAENPPLVSDLRRITYWLASGGTTGLARQEIKVATSDDALNAPAYPDDASFIIAEEVQGVEFQYWDGTN